MREVTLSTGSLLGHILWLRWFAQDINQIYSLKLDPKKEARFKVTRLSEYGERYKVFVIEKNTFESKFTLENYGINLSKEENVVIVDMLTWNG